MTIRENLLKAIEILKAKNVEEPILKAKLLLAFVLDKSREYVMINSEDEIEPEFEKKYNLLLKKIIDNVPLQYITNYQEFMGLDFYVNEDVLIPRADTETLVEEILKLIDLDKKYKILELCTGSGAIAVSLAKNILYTEILATDISKEALKIANRNAIFNEVDAKVNFLESNMFNKIKESKYDIIVSNPPYIETSVIRELPKDVQKEPKIALDGGKTGLDFYKIILEKAKEYLNEGGLLCLEIGYDQKEKLLKLFSEHEEYKNIKCIKDLGGNDRVIICNV